LKQLKEKLDDKIQSDLVRLYQEEELRGDMSPFSPKSSIALKIERLEMLSPRKPPGVGSPRNDGMIQIDSDVRNAWLPGVNTGSISKLSASTLVQKPRHRRISRESPNVKLKLLNSSRTVSMLNNIDSSKI
jgi:hypothetical protein